MLWPPLSKKYLSGELERERLLLRSPTFYENSHVEVRLGVRAVSVNYAARRARIRWDERGFGATESEGAC